MAASAEIEVFGVRDALRELGQIDKKQRLAAIAKVKAAGGDMVAVARENYPSNAAMSDVMPGWSEKGRLGYSKAKADRGVKIKVGGRAFGNAYAVVTLTQTDPGAALYDIAGLRQGSKGAKGTDKSGRRRDASQSAAFLRNLDNGFGPAQRGAWRQIRRIRELANGALMKALNDVAESVNRKLVA